MRETSANTRNAKTIAAVGRWLHVSRYDRVSSALLAMLVTVGAVAVLLFVVWLTGRITDHTHVAVAPTLLPSLREGEGGGDGRESGGSQTRLDTPVNEPVVGKSDQTVGVQDSLSMLDVTAASKTPDFDDPEALIATLLGNRGAGDGVYGGVGPGRGLDWGDRPPGRKLKKELDTPRIWEVSFSTSTLDAYARQLDFFRIELAVLLPDDKLGYAYNLSKPKPDTRIAAAAEEKRFYLTWRSGDLQQADRELLARAELEAGDHIVVKFLPPQIEAQLAAMEKGHAGADPKRIRKTRFGVRAEGSGFKFFVIEQILKR